MVALALGASACMAEELPVVERVDSMTNCYLKAGAVFAFSTNFYAVKAEELFLEAATNLSCKAGFDRELEQACKAGVIERRTPAQVGRPAKGGWLVARPGGKHALVDESGRFARDFVPKEEAEGRLPHFVDRPRRRPRSRRRNH
jgi:hypothetical protein